MIINPKYSNNNELKDAQAKLKEYEEEYNKIQIDEIQEFKQKIFNVLKCYVDDDDDYDDRLKE